MEHEGIKRDSLSFGKENPGEITQLAKKISTRPQFDKAPAKHDALEEEFLVIFWCPTLRFRGSKPTKPKRDLRV